MESNVRVRYPQAKESRKVIDRSFHRNFGGCVAQLTPWFQSLTLQNCVRVTSVVLMHPVDGNSLCQPLEIHTIESHANALSSQPVLSAIDRLISWNYPSEAT